MRKILFTFVLLFASLQANDKLGVYEKLGETISLDIPFFDENGKETTFRKLMDGKPAIATLNYYECPGICSPQLNDLALTLERLDLVEGDDYNVITVSIHKGDTPALASQKKRNHIASIQRSFNAKAWHFLLGKEDGSKQFADSVGFHYEKTVGPSGKVDYIHPAVLVVLSPEGKITRYLNGVDQLPFDVKMSLIEASDGKVGPTIAKTLLFCFAYDAENKKYVFAWEKIIATVMLLIVFSFFIYLVKTGRKDQDNKKQGEIDE